MPSLKELSTDELRVLGDAIETVIDCRDYLPPGGMLLMEAGKLRDEIRGLLLMPPLGRVTREPGRKPLDSLAGADLDRLTEAVLILTGAFPDHLDPEMLRRLIDLHTAIVFERRTRALADQFAPERRALVWARIAEGIGAS